MGDGFVAQLMKYGRQTVDVSSVNGKANATEWVICPMVAIELVTWEDVRPIGCWKLAVRSSFSNRYLSMELDQGEGKTA